MTTLPSTYSWNLTAKQVSAVLDETNAATIISIADAMSLTTNLVHSKVCNLMTEKLKNIRAMKANRLPMFGAADATKSQVREARASLLKEWIDADTIIDNHSGHINDALRYHAREDEVVTLLRKAIEVEETWRQPPTQQARYNAAAEQMAVD